MTLILCCCWFNVEHNNFHAAHNDLMATAITESNLIVDDSDELSSKIFTAFPSFRESHSLLTPSQLNEDLWRAVTPVVTRVEWRRELVPLITGISVGSVRAGAERVRVHRARSSAAPLKLNLPCVPAWFYCFRLSVLWAATHGLLPESSWIKYTWWRAKKCVFFSTRLYAWVARFYLSPLTSPVCGQWSPAVSAGCKHREETQGSNCPCQGTGELPLLLWFH